ncbi:hypothetical protein H4R33_006791 [Dimargaris cristalligena]|nr:hypothetical protein H4R33_006791 [Dimargaris cristalligena]
MSIFAKTPPAVLGLMVVAFHVQYIVAQPLSTAFDKGSTSTATTAPQAAFPLVRRGLPLWNSYFPDEVPTSPSAQTNADVRQASFVQDQVEDFSLEDSQYINMFHVQAHAMITTKALSILYAQPTTSLYVSDGNGGQIRTSLAEELIRERQLTKDSLKYVIYQSLSDSTCRVLFPALYLVRTHQWDILHALVLDVYQDEHRYLNDVYIDAYPENDLMDVIRDIDAPVPTVPESIETTSLLASIIGAMVTEGQWNELIEFMSQVHQLIDQHKFVPEYPLLVWWALAFTAELYYHPAAQEGLTRTESRPMDVFLTAMDTEQFSLAELASCAREFHLDQLQIFITYVRRYIGDHSDSSFRCPLTHSLNDFIRFNYNQPMAILVDSRYVEGLVGEPLEYIY